MFTLSCIFSISNVPFTCLSYTKWHSKSLKESMVWLTFTTFGATIKVGEGNGIPWFYQDVATQARQEVTVNSGQRKGNLSKFQSTSLENQYNLGKSSFEKHNVLHSCNGPYYLTVKMHNVLKGSKAWRLSICYTNPGKRMGNWRPESSERSCLMHRPGWCAVTALLPRGLSLNLQLGSWLHDPKFLFPQKRCELFFFRKSAQTPWWYWTWEFRKWIAGHQTAEKNKWKTHKYLWEFSLVLI